jgi:transcriptional regulator of arginine metabolism
MSTDNVLDDYILDVIQHNEIKEQKDLQDVLKKRGYDIPQATLSRRLRKLKISKIEGVYKGILSPHHKLPLILNLQISEFGIIVMHTHPGQANSLAYFIDQTYVNNFHAEKSSVGILGTIAGDDTVLLIVKNNNSLKNTLTALYQDFPYLKREAPKL